MLQVDVALVLELAPEELIQIQTVVIDVLRATSTIVAALGAGVPYVVPVASVEAARSQAVAYEQRGGCYLGGERNRVRPDGFDCGNSPLEYLQLGSEKPVVFTTTNGTRALQQVSGSRRVLIGSCGNASAVAAELLAAGNEGQILLVCSGTLGRVAAEDVLCAGLMVEALQNRAPVRLTDAARLALASYQQVASDLAGYLQTTSGGQALCRLGQQADVLHAAQVDYCRWVPYYHNGRISL